MQNAITPAKETPQIIEKEFDIDAFIEKRKEFIEKVNAIMVEGKDYHLIQGRKSMAKGGAEKIASIFGWTAAFTKDGDAMEAFSDLKGVICFVCNLSKNGQTVGQGRGAALLSKNSGDPNKTLKMAQKSAFVDAVIRSSGLSDFYTQDLEDMDASTIQTSNASLRGSQSVSGNSSNNIQPSKVQYNLISKLMEQKGYSKEDLIDAGFVPGTLTGGKEGTASELIDYLLQARTKINSNGNPNETQNSVNNEINVEDIPY